tara:strand:- start:454 stop:576 length:123 start_codon:yes stop_codon:yes gene_type:complete
VALFATDIKEVKDLLAPEISPDALEEALEEFLEEEVELLD